MEPVDDLVRHTAFALLVRDGRPVPVERLAASHPGELPRLALDEALDRLVAAGGLTLGDAPHRLLL